MEIEEDSTTNENIVSLRQALKGVKRQAIEKKVLSIMSLIRVSWKHLNKLFLRDSSSTDYYGFRNG